MSQDNVVITVETEEIEVSIEPMQDVNLIIKPTPDVLILGSANVGPPGSLGEQGPEGLAGEHWFSGIGAPSAAMGVSGDFYLNSTNGDYYEKTDDSTWTLRGNLKGPQGNTGSQGPQGNTGSQGPQGNTGSQGPQGTAGTPGEKWYSGAGAPATGLGIVGDWYLNTTNGDVYEKTGAATWTVVTNIKGPTGNTGSQGVQGIQGPQGNTGATGQAEAWYSGAGAPPGATGVVGDWYLDTTTDDIHEKTGASAWTLRANIKGSTGATGTTGGKWFTGGTIPGAGTGVVGDFYLNSANGDYYEKTGTTIWTLRGNLKGPIGNTGATGVAEVWYSGAGAPPGATGVIGDWYLDTTTGDVHEKTGASAWTLRANIKGATGSTGTAGTAGEKWFSGAGAPAGGTGAVGDWYLDTTAGDVYEKTGASAWTLRANIKGPAGTTGGKWFTAAGTPATGTGVVGDFYINSTNGDYYEKTGAAVWTLRGNLKGPQGIQGPTGNTGTTGNTGSAGTPGEKWFTGAGAPAGGLAGSIVGDWYLDSVNGDYYEKTGASAWTLRGNLKGPSGVGTLPADVVVTASAHLIRNRLLVGDTQPSFRLLGDGSMEWGPGGTTAPDVVLQRYFGPTLRVSGGLNVNSALVLNGEVYQSSASWFINSGGYHQWGPGDWTRDTNLYRHAAGILGTDGSIYLKSSTSYLSFTRPGEQSRFYIGPDGTHNWGSGAAAPDVNLYRWGVDFLRTDDSFSVVGAIYSDAGITAKGGMAAYYTDAFWQTTIGYVAGAPGPGIFFSAANDTNLYRSAANALRTDDDFFVGGGIRIDNLLGTYAALSVGGNGIVQVDYPSIGGGRLFLDAEGQLRLPRTGSVAGIIIGGDANLYRDEVGILKTTGAFRIGTDLHVGKDNGYGIIYFGADANLQRVAANQLRVSGILETMGYVVVNAGSASQLWLHPDGGIYFGQSADTVLKRASAARLRTDGDFEIIGTLIGGGRVGEYAKYPVSMDFNNANTNGWWMVSNGLNTPLGGAGWWIAEVICHNNIWTTQRAWDFTAGVGSPVYERRNSGGTWTSWMIVDIPNSIIDAKGDLIVGLSADTPTRLPVGANNTVLTADSTTGAGLKWAAPAAGLTSYTQSFNISNTLAESTLFSQALPALSANAVIEIAMIGYFLQNRGGGSDLALKVLLGATTMWGDGTGGQNYANSVLKRPLMLIGQLANIASTSSQVFDAYVTTGLSPQAGSFGGVGQLAAGDSPRSVGGVAAEATATSKVLAIKATMGHASALEQLFGEITVTIITP